MQMIKNRLETDIIVVGSGAGGAAIAGELHSFLKRGQNGLTHQAVMSAIIHLLKKSCPMNYTWQPFYSMEMSQVPARAHSI